MPLNFRTFHHSHLPKLSDNWEDPMLTMLASKYTAVPILESVDTQTKKPQHGFQMLFSSTKAQHNHVQML